MKEASEREERLFPTRTRSEECQRCRGGRRKESGRACVVIFFILYSKVEAEDSNVSGGQ